MIFLGITMAIWFNNWNERQKSRQVEIRSLQEIQNAIHQDLVDMEENLFGFGQRVVLYKLLVQHIEEGLPMDDSLRSMLPYLQGITTFLSNTGPYETLKSRGLETISNDSIRLRISLYYDFEFEKLQSNEKQHYQHSISYLKPLMMKHFNLSDYRLEPLDYEQMIHDFEFRQTIYWALRTDSYMLELYKDLFAIAQSLVKDLEEEIGRLD